MLTLRQPAEQIAERDMILIGERAKLVTHRAI
jgi:hypothetical protein